MGILRVEVGVGLTATTALLDLGQHLALGLELGLEQLALRTTIRYAIIAHGKRETFGDVVFTGVGLAPRKDAFARFGTLVDFEGLVLQLRADPATEVAVFDGLVLVEHANHRTVALGGQVHQTFHHILGHHAIVDVVDQIADTIEDHQVGMAIAYRGFEHRQALGNGLLADIEDIELVGRKLTWLDACHLADALAEDVLGGLIALLGIIPEDMQLSWLDPRHGEHFVANAQRHQDAADKCLAALGLAGETGQLATGKAGLTMKLEEELHGWEVLERGDPARFQLVKPLLVFSRETG